MTPTTKQRLSMTAGKNGLAPLQAIPEPTYAVRAGGTITERYTEAGALTLALLLAEVDHISSTVVCFDGDRVTELLHVGAPDSQPTGLHRALVTAMSRATTWRT